MTQQAVITVWKDGSTRVQGAMDAEYCKTDEDYLVTRSLEDLLAEAAKDSDLRIRGEKETV